MGTNNVSFTPSEIERFNLIKQENVFIFPTRDESGCIALAKYLCRDSVAKYPEILNPYNGEYYIEKADSKVVELLNNFIDSIGGSLINVFDDANDPSIEALNKTRELLIYICDLNSSQMEIFINAYNNYIELDLIRKFVQKDISFYISNVVYLALKQDNINLMDYIDINNSHPYVVSAVYNAIQRGIFDSLSDLNFGDSRTRNILLLASYASDLGYGFVYDKQHKTFVAIPVDELDDDTDINLSININKEKISIE